MQSVKENQSFVTESVKENQALVKENVKQDLKENTMDCKDYVNSERYEHAQMVLKRLRAVGKRPKHCVKKFNRSRGRVSHAFKGMAPELLEKIENWVNVLETEHINKQKKVA